MVAAEKKEGERICYRLRTIFPLRFKQKENASFTRAQGRDLSPSGIGLNASKMIPEGETLSLEFRLPGSFRKIKAEVQVVRSTQSGSLKKPYPYFLGTRLVKISHADSDFLGDYIVSREQFWTLRSAVLILSFFLSLSVLFRVLNVLFLNYYNETPLSTEGAFLRWSISGIALYGTLNALFAFWLAFCGLGVFLFKKWAKSGLLLLSLIGIFTQAIRLTVKAQIAFNDFSVFRNILIVEGSFCLAFIVLFLFLVGKKFGERFDLVFAPSEDHPHLDHGHKKDSGSKGEQLGL